MDGALRKRSPLSPTDLETFNINLPVDEDGAGGGVEGIGTGGGVGGGVDGVVEGGVVGLSSDELEVGGVGAVVVPVETLSKNHAAVKPCLPSAVRTRTH